MTQPRHIALIGPMGAGKSSIGRYLAKVLERPFVDLDRCIEDQAGASIPWVFEKEGEPRFRQREREALLAALQGDGHVIACGGGIVLDPDNRTALRDHAFVVLLLVSVEEQLQRLARDRSRPLLHTDDRRARLESLASHRDPLYAETADLIFHAGEHGPSQAAQLLGEQLLKHSPTERTAASNS